MVRTILATIYMAAATLGIVLLCNSYLWPGILGLNWVWWAIVLVAILLPYPILLLSNLLFFVWVAVPASLIGRNKTIPTYIVIALLTVGVFRMIHDIWAVDVDLTTARIVVASLLCLILAAIAMSFVSKLEKLNILSKLYEQQEKE